VRAGFCLGGAGSGFVNSDAELVTVAEQAFIAAGSRDACILLDKSLRGWKELELEIMRDMYGNKLCICAMENVDPLGVHTGESIVVAPCQTLTDNEYQTMRDIAFQIADQIGIVGECNVQFTINPQPVNLTHPEIYVIEMNARLSRSSALASKATGYPIAAIAAKLQIGFSLLDLPNPCVVIGHGDAKHTSAFFEPALDYIVVKIPRWDLDKTPGVSYELGSAMKSVGEAMGIGRNFREALMKAIRMVGLPGVNHLGTGMTMDGAGLEPLANATPDRVLKLFSAIYHSSKGDGGNRKITKELNRITGITTWFLDQIQAISDVCIRLESTSANINSELLYQAKLSGLSDIQIAHFANLNHVDIAALRDQYGIRAKPRRIDTVAGEFPCATNYMYLSYESHIQGSSCHTPGNGVQSVIILGSGVYRIGSSVEFDWCAVETSREARHLGWKSILVNCNPETVSTDYDEADILYFEELSSETICEIWRHESNSRCGSCKGVIVGMGGQAANNIVMDLSDSGVPILGTPAEMIDNAENRFKFSRMCDTVKIDQPLWSMVTSLPAAAQFCDSVGYPVLVRPSYVLSGAGMAVIHTARDLEGYLANAKSISPAHPVVISQFIMDAKEIEVDAVAQNGRIVIMAISEHVENAGVHSGDASLVLPAQDLTSKTIDDIKEIAFKIAAQLTVSGPMNIQLIAKADKLKVIECNLRASRSFPFASRTLNINFIKLATQVILYPDLDISDTIPDKFTVEKVGVKVPMFSTARLTGAQVQLGVEMQSTGEVACFGPNRNIAYLKAMMSAGMRLPPMLNASVLFISNDELTVTRGYMRDMHWTVICETGPSIEQCLTDIRAGRYHMVFILVEPALIDPRLARTAVDSRVPVCINIKQAKLLIESIYYYYHNSIRLDPWFDIQYPQASSQAQQHTPTPNNHALSPAVVANSMQCVSYKPDIVIHPPVTQIIFTDKHILTAEQFNRNLLRQIFKRSSELRNGIGMGKPLAGKVIGLIFYTPSTRTRCSFESAIKRLGGETILVGANESSVQKGESLYDTIKTLDCYTDGLVIRAANNMNLMSYRNTSRHSVINAGDLDEHPTQSLLDLFTIREERGSVNGLRIAFIGDLLNGRTVHSLAKMLCNYDVDMYFVSSPEYMIPDEIIQYIQAAKAAHPNLLINWQPVTTHAEWLDHIAPLVDVIYMTRHQAERLNLNVSEQTANGLRAFYLDRDVMSRLKQTAIVLHPLPRNEEIPVELDTDPRCKYFRQMEYGLYVRMALAELVFGR
jgi:carbamoyl-phosphate synthase/aspartate carbamoyltransferase